MLCDTHEPPRVKDDGSVIPTKPIPTNTRFECMKVMEEAAKHEPWFGIE